MKKILLLFCITCVIAIAVIWLQASRTRVNVKYNMRFMEVSRHIEWPEEERLMFQFVKFPGHYLEIVSGDLAKQLDLSHDNFVEAEFSLVIFRGKIHDISVKRVGSATEWKSSWTYFFISGPEHPSPWETVKLK